ncbi:MAG: nodulation protein NfeD [Aquificota bacterium]|jgi:membrane-bound serine protease (ClpP class)|nr:nodulation protein NfeD [Aquificaceae bacterium]HCO38424.1 serine protease [Aquificaceae bacterium]
MKLLIILLSLIAFSNAKIFISKWQEAVTPLMVDHIKRSLQKAEKEGGSLFILELNTPGGLESSMREVIQEFQRTPLPVVVFVYPPGGRAASAGAIITLSADVAVMAPGTNIGAATPVQMGGEKMDEAMKQKVMQDMLAFVRSIAKEKGRNPEIAEKMVTQAISLTPEEALKERIIDLIATDRKDLLEKLDGRVIKKHGREMVIKAKDLQVVEVGKSLREEFLSIITNPTIAYMLLLIGFYGIFFELYNPGTIIPGTVGIICFLLGLYGLGVIGINWLGLLLILAGILLLILELITPTFGGLAVAGAIALALGSLILISPDSPYGDIPISVIATMVILTVGFFLFAGRLGLKAQRRKKMLGAEELIGEQGEAYTDFVRGKGKVFIHGEIWNAISDEPIQKGDTVVVEEVKGMTLKVRKV